ncbi:MAG: type 4a pilus biogenesis protein PilO [Clostridia bacterium]|nr:type 4a pilus biogenesis protein PilO [Clostridia bacterium]
MKRSKIKKLNSKTSVMAKIKSDNRGISTSDIIVTVVAVIVIIVSTIFLVSNIITLRGINSEIDEIKITIAEKQDALNKLIELGKSEDILREDYDRSMLYIPEERDEVGITSDITSIIIDSDGLFRSLTFNKELILENGITDIPFSVRVDCTYDNLNLIIDEIGKAERLYIVDSVIIIDTNSEELSADISIHAYYRKK